MKIAYVNGRLFDGSQLLSNKVLLVCDGKIESIVNPDQIPETYHREDLKGAILSPAFIDLQIYGGNGKMFSQDTDEDSLAATNEYCKNGGCGYFMITMATNSIDKFIEGFAVIRNYWKNGGQGLLGFHLEGPYLNPVKKGAHVEKFIKKPTLDEVKMLLDKGGDTIKMITLAPECCDPAIVQYLLDKRVLVSAGHTNASYQEATRAFNNGIPVATHLFNAMSGLMHRSPGMVGAIFDHPSAMSSIVCDGIHVDFAAVRIAKKIMKERLFYITDAVSEVKEGAYQHLFKGDHFALPDGTLSGSALTMVRCVQNGVEKVGIALEESLRMATSYPASLINESTLGSLVSGNRAKLIVFNDRFELQKFIDG